MHVISRRVEFMNTKVSPVVGFQHFKKVKVVQRIILYSVIVKMQSIIYKS